MFHTTPQTSAFRLESTPRALACGLPVVAIAALLLGFGCGEDEPSSNPEQGIASQQPGGGMAPPSTVLPGDPTNEGNPNATLEPGTPAAFVENSGADCEIGALPTAAELTELQTLPDPFMALGGERLTSKAQWRCRRQEILKLAEGFIYGEKPGKPESVSGTVTDTSITVDLANQGQTASFTATITMPANVTG
ncbi:MAG: hypothetical protein RL033_6980, partial [Pseudomonadota bacterium]